MTLPTAIDRAKKQPDKIATLKKYFIRLCFYHQLTCESNEWNKEEN